MSPQKTIKVLEKFNGQRLDVFLSARLSRKRDPAAPHSGANAGKITRSQIQKMIEAGLVLVNEKTPKKMGDRVKMGDIIKISNFKFQISNQIQIPQFPKTEKNPSEIKIIAETNDYLVVDKPTGMLTHSTTKEETDSLAEILLKKNPEIKKVGEDPARPGIVHRLDKDASGLLVVARTNKMFDCLKEQFKQRKIDKEYLALVHGAVQKDAGEINFPLVRSERNRRMAARPKTGWQGEDGLTKSALTYFSVEKKFVNFTLLRVKIHTGRMHQIRAHMLAYNHPVVGDTMYFQKKQKKKWDDKLGRLFLHCTKLVFKDLENKTQSFESPLSPELSDFLNKLK